MGFCAQSHPRNFDISRRFNFVKATSPHLPKVSSIVFCLIFEEQTEKEDLSLGYHLPILIFCKPPFSI